MITENSSIAEKGHELMETPVCSLCGVALKSPYEGIALDNGIEYCAHCYQAFLFPDVRSYDTEMPDEVC
jgi:hypothetical protein